jgi:hypothetical protein
MPRSEAQMSSTLLLPREMVPESRAYLKVIGNPLIGCRLQQELAQF